MAEYKQASEERLPLGIRLKALRKEAGISIPQLAEKSGLYNYVISKIETLPDKDQSLDNVQCYAEACGIEIRIQVVKKNS